MVAVRTEVRGLHIATGSDYPGAFMNAMYDSLHSLFVQMAKAEGDFDRSALFCL